MKRILTLLAAVLIGLTALAQNRHYFSYETGSFDLVANVMGSDMTTHTVFADYGALQYCEVEMMGQKYKTVIRDGKNYIVSPMFQEVEADEPVNYSDLSPEAIRKYDIKMVGLESLDGYECLVYTLKMEVQGMQANAKVWIWEGFSIRSEATVMGMKMTTTLKNLKLDAPVDMSLFELPKK